MDPLLHRGATPLASGVVDQSLRHRVAEYDQALQHLARLVGGGRGGLRSGASRRLRRLAQFKDTRGYRLGTWQSDEEYLMSSRWKFRAPRLTRRVRDDPTGQNASPLRSVARFPRSGHFAVLKQPNLPQYMNCAALSFESSRHSISEFRRQSVKEMPHGGHHATSRLKDGVHDASW